MPYTTVAELKQAVEFEYWKQIRKKLTADGYTVTQDAFASETVFLQQFVDRMADYIDAYAGGPFAQNSVLQDINKVLALFEVEQYILSGRGDRTVNITIISEKKRVLKLLQGILDGEIPVEPETVATNAAPDLIESDTDGITLTMGGLESDLFFGSATAEEIPE